MFDGDDNLWFPQSEEHLSSDFGAKKIEEFEEEEEKYGIDDPRFNS